MYTISTQYLRTGMVLGQGICHRNGGFLLTKGTILNSDDIEKLKRLRVPAVYVTSLKENLNVLPPAAIIQERTRIQAIKNVFNSFETWEQKRSINLDGIKTSVQHIINDLTRNEALNEHNLVQGSDIRLHDDYTFAHSVNVAVLASLLGNELHYAEHKLHDLVLGSLLHDIGKTKVPPDILNKASRLGLSEEEVIRMHPEDGFRILYDINRFPYLPMNISLQHHEHFDGSGYPFHLIGKEIHEFSRIVGIADVYDALTSERPYKRAYKPDMAYHMMTRCMPGQFDPELLSLFFRHVALYPVGTILRAGQGYAIVSEVVANATQRPVIRLFADENQKLLDRPPLLDLRDYPNLTIQYVLGEQELMDLLKEIQFDPAEYLAGEEKIS